MKKINNPPSGPARVRKVAFYVRVSTDRQAQVVEGSLKNQEQMLAAELRRRNTQKKWGRLVGSYVDGGFSGKNTERPEFKRLMADVERGAIDAVFFTELSRLSRSLRDFLHIFEFTQDHGCDLVCLKTEIDTTSPFSNLVVRILMVFAEFEREMTSDRIRRNAYERSKRGLAYGGFEPLGYKRDPEHKGWRLVDAEETKIVRDIFSIYIRERSLMKTLGILKKNYNHPRIAKLSRNGIYGILTSKVYIGVREINNNGSIEEVPATWQAIITNKTFEQVRNILSGNGPGPRSPRHNYIFAGLIRCAKCGQKLQGKSGKGRSGKPWYYYSHAKRCTEGGLHSIEADDAHKLVEDWLTAISQDKDRFGELVENGRNELNKRLRVMNSNLKRLDHEDAALRKRLHDMTTRTLAQNIPASSALLEKESDQLLAELQNNERESEELKSEAETLTAILNTGDATLFQSYAERIKRYLSSSAREKARRVFEIFRTLTIGEQNLNVDLGQPNEKSFRSDAVTIVRDKIPLPGILLLKSKAYLRRLYRDEKLSARAIARKIGASSSTVSDYLQRYGLIAEAKEQKKRAQHLPFGYDYKNGKLIQNRKEQQIIRTVRQLRVTGLTLRDIAAHLNRKLVPTKKGGVWEPGILYRMLNRSK